MRKSPIKQMFLCALCGPPGLCYTSMQAALSFTLITLLSILFFEKHSLWILLGSMPLSVIIGFLMVRSRNKKLAVHDFTPSTYIGQVSCQVIGKEAVKRNYHKLLTKARWKNKLNNHANTALGGMCTIVVAVIAIPNLLEVFNDAPVGETPQMQALLDNPVDDSIKFEFLDSGQWKLSAGGAKDFHASLMAEEYQNSTDGWYRPKLSLSCIDNKTRLFFETSEILGTENAGILISYEASGDPGKLWKTTEDYRSAMAPAPISLAKAINANNHMSVTYTPFGAPQSKTATFNLKDSDSIVQSVRQKCGW